MKIRCGLCPGDNWVPVDGVMDHLEEEHGHELQHAARWPDGKLVIFNEDEIDEFTG